MGPASSGSPGPGRSGQLQLTAETLRIREVWADNLDEEMSTIRDIVDDFPYLAMDTEFPGIVRPVAELHSRVLDGSEPRGVASRAE